MVVITREEYQEAAHALLDEKGEEGLSKDNRETFEAITNGSIIEMLLMIDRLPDIIAGIQMGLRIASNRMAKDLEEYAKDNTSRR